MTASYDVAAAPPDHDHTAVIYRGALIDSPTHPDATAMLVVDGIIRWLGPAEDAPEAGATVVELGGFSGKTVLLPAFVDAHVHTTATGLAITGLNVAGCHNVDELLDRVATHAAGVSGGVVIGHGWDPSSWTGDQFPSGQQLERAAPGVRVYLAKVDVHSALASESLRAAVPRLAGLAGYCAEGALTREAHHAVRQVALAGISTPQRTAAQRATRRAAADVGIGAVHECGGPLIGGDDDFVSLLNLSKNEPGVEVYGLWGEADPTKARELGAVSAGGDLFIDGSFGSATAHVREPYLATPQGQSPHGYSYLNADEIAAHVVACVEHRIPAGFHAIGDAALAALVDGYAKAASIVDVAALRAARHRIEHAHLIDAEIIKSLVEYGLTASVQPTFDALWGGQKGMYAARLGADRAARVMPLSALAGTGVPMAFGSDSPAGPLDPWRALRAAVHPHNEYHALSPRAAFAAHTRGGWRSIGFDNAGVLAPGNPATFAVWSAPAAWGDRFELTSILDFLKVATHEADAVDPVLRATVVRGVNVEVSADGRKTPAGSGRGSSG